MGSALEADVTALARRLAELGAGERARIVQSSWWSERMLEWAMSHPSFKTQLFRFVDVFPATVDDADVLRHLEEYFRAPKAGHESGAPSTDPRGLAGRASQAEVPRVVDLGLGVADHVPFGKTAAASVARRNLLRMANQFIVGRDPTDAAAGLEQLWRAGTAFTVDLLGEKTVTEDQADRYAARVEELVDVLLEATTHWPPDDHLERDDLGPLARVNVSVKPSALASSYSPLTREEGLAKAKGRLRPILRRAWVSGAFVNFDMEHYDSKDLTLQLFRELLGEAEFADLEAGAVIQAYLKDSFDDLADLIAWSSGRSRPITVRLVKGAYWDTETVLARAEGWPVPVYDDK